MMAYLDGWEATRIIRALPRKDAKKVTILAMSANAFSDDIQKSYSIGMNEHIVKPVSLDSIKKLYLI